MTSGDSGSDDDLRQLALRASLGAALRQRGWMVRLVLAALVVVGVVELSADWWLGPDGTDRLLLAGALAPLRVLQGEWWRIYTGPWLHADLWHLAFNGFALLTIGRLVEAAFGRSRFWLIFAVSGLTGALGTLVHAMSEPHAWSPMVRVATASASVGASGSVFGLMAAMLAFGLKLWPRLRGDLRRSLVLVPAALLLLMLALGEAGGGQIDAAAHFGGALGGLAMGLGLRARLPVRTPPPPLAGRAVRLVAWGLALLVPLALGLAWLRVDHEQPVPRVVVKRFEAGGATFTVPRDLPVGLLRQGRCQVRLVDPAWALETERELCWQLPLDGVLALGRRDRLLTLDDDDLATMRKSQRTSLFLRRQPSVLLAPVGRHWVLTVIAPEPLLPALADAVQPLVSAPDSIHVDAPWHPSEPAWWRAVGIW
jgi:membrane associated rhomboid family serine protease